MRYRFRTRCSNIQPAVVTEKAARWIIRGATVMLSIFVLLGGFFTVQGVIDWRRAAESASWPTVSGTVTKSVVTSHSSTHKGSTTTSYHAHIEFDYQVDGTTRHGNRRTYKVMGSSEAAAREAVAAYPVGRAVTVSVDPEDPDRAVLEPGQDWANAIPIAVGLFAIAFAWFVRWLVVRKLRQTMQRMKELQAIGIDPMASDPAAPLVPTELKPTYHDDLPGAR